jgi:hypothetical protein
MIQWLHRYIFRGIGVLFLVGMITFLILAVSSQAHHDTNKPVSAPASERR